MRSSIPHRTAAAQSSPNPADRIPGLEHLGVPDRRLCRHRAFGAAYRREWAHLLGCYGMKEKT
jgi:hypothetical protein